MTPEQAAADVALRIYRPTPSSYFLKALIYGDPGVGKTTFAATAANHGRLAKPLVVNIEGGTLSLINAVESGLNETPDVIDLESWAELESIFLYLQHGEHPFQTLIIDSLSELCRVNLDSVVAQALAKDRNNKRDGVDDVWLDDHGKSAQQMTRVLRAFRDLPMHVIFTCHALQKMDKDKKIIDIGPALPPKLRQAVIGYMDVVGYMYTEEETAPDGKSTRLARRMLTQPYGLYIAKDRSPGGRLGDRTPEGIPSAIMADPTLPKCIDRIDGVYNVEEGQ